MARSQGRIPTLDESRERCAAASRARNEAAAGMLGHFDIGVFVEGFAPFPRLALESIAPRLYAFNVETWKRFQETGQGLHPRILPIRRDSRGRATSSESCSALISLPVGDGPWARACSFATNLRIPKT